MWASLARPAFIALYAQRVKNQAHRCGSGAICRVDQGLRVHCKDCALVTSSGQLIGSGQGAEIDGAECVIRMNDAPTWGYQEDVGHRTSLRVVAHSSIQQLLQKGGELLNASCDPVFIFWGPSSCMRRDGKGRLYNHLQLLQRIRPCLKLHTITRQKMLHFDELFKRETGKDRYEHHRTQYPDSLGAGHSAHRTTEELPTLSPWHHIHPDSERVPEDWKMANVTPLFKKGGRQERGNYRLFSLTSVIGKTLESIIKYEIVEDLDVH
eukprot:g43665.t1